MTEHLKTDLADGILSLTLSRADKKNALTPDMYNALSDGLTQAEANSQVKVILLQSDGDSFTAGNDLSDFAARASGEILGESPAVRFINALVNTSKPVVAAVQGNAVGIGTTMLLHCDLVYMSEDARLITPFVNLALVPEAASSWLLPLRIGHARAYAMFALGEPVNAASAVSLGLATAVVPAAELRSHARASATKLAERPAGSLKQTKLLMREIQRMSDQMTVERKQFDLRLRSEEAKEAFNAFSEKRKSDFSRCDS